MSHSAVEFMLTCAMPMTRTNEGTWELPEHVRPTPVLETTVGYLCATVVPMLGSFTGDRLCEWHMFVSDRFRAVRKDARIQGLVDICPNPTIVALFERMLRFHILCGYYLSELQDSKGAGFVDDMNVTAVTQLLVDLNTMYNRISRKAEPSAFQNEPEVRGYELLFRAYCSVQYMLFFFSLLISLFLLKKIGKFESGRHPQCSSLKGALRFHLC